MFWLASNYFWQSLIYFTISFKFSNADVRMVCPRPVSPRSDIRNPSISLGKNKCLVEEDSEKDVMEVYPGLFTIRFEETKFMIGSPFRVLLFTSSEDQKGRKKRDLKMDKRDTTEVTTDSTNFVQTVFSKINHSLNAIVNFPNNILLHNGFNQSTINVSDSNGEHNITFGDLSTASHTESVSQFESSTTSNLHDLTTDNLPEDSITEGSRESKSDSGSKSKADEEIQSCVLLDHIPHNDQSVINDKCSKQGSSFPLGICEESTYFITIRIPDVFCPDCFLVVQQIEAKPDHEVCDVSSLNESKCVSYISCSRISIRPSTEGMNRSLSQCSQYLDNLPDDWAYRPQDVYKAGDSAVLTMDLLHKDLHLEVMRGLIIGPTEKVEIRHNQVIIWNASMADSHMNADSLLMVWNNIPDSYKSLLKDSRCLLNIALLFPQNNKLVLNIIGSKKSQALDIIFESQIFGEGKMSLLHDVYSDDGWLIANRFLGPKAKDPMAALPVGPCVPSARHFLVFFGAVEEGFHGLLGMTLLDNRAYITALLHVKLGTILSIRFRGSELGAKDIVVKVPDSFLGVFQVALDLTQQMQYIDTADTLMTSDVGSVLKLCKTNKLTFRQRTKPFLKVVEVNTNRQNAILVGNLEEGFYCVLRDHNGRVKGLGAFQPTQGYWMRAEIVISNLAESVPKVKTARLLGSHVELMDVSKETTHCTQEFCCLETYVHELSSEFLLHLLSGQARVEITTESDDISGQIVGSNDCSRYGDICLLSDNLSANNALTEKYGGIVNAIVLLDRAEVLEISVQANHPDWDLVEKNYTAQLISKDGISDKLPLSFLWISKEIYTSKGRFPLTKHKKISKMLHKLNEPIQLHISNDVHTLLKDKVYGLKKKGCIQNKYHVVGKDKNFWSPISSPFNVTYSVVMDHIKFIYDDNTTSLYLMDSKESFSKCNFNKSKRIEPTRSVEGLAVNFYKLTTPGTLYFADKQSCLSDTPAKLKVQVMKGKESLVDDRSQENWCRTSFYSAWRQDQLSKWEPPSIAGPVVLGLFLGVVTGIGFILWQGMKMKQMSGPSTSANRNSLSHFVRF